MTTIVLRRFVGALVLLGCSATVALAADPAPPPPKLTDLLRMKRGTALVFQPVHLRRGTTLLVTHTKFADGSVKPGEMRAIQFVVYSSTRNDLTGEFPVLFTDLQITDGTAEAAGPHVRVFNGYTPDSDGQGVIAGLIGLLLPAVQSDPVKTVPLPTNDAITAEISNPAGDGLLLPAVQKIKVAAGK